MEKLVMLLALLVVPSFAETPQDFFKAGNALYAEGKFSEAAQKYQSATDAHFRHWILEYNLGNAYYRAGELGQAILHYERAFRINSGQKDVIYNLDLATRRAGDPELPSGALPQLAWRLFYFLSINTLSLFVSLLFIILCGVAGTALVGRKIMSIEWVVGVGMLLVVLSVWLGTRISFIETPEGVVVTSLAEVRSGPNTTYPANFTVPEGRRVLLLKEQEPIEGWVEIGVPDQGLKGWTPDSSVKAI